MNFWSQLPNKPKTEIAALLTEKLGSPDNEFNRNLFQELVKKINSYYSEEPEQNHSTHFFFGYLSQIQEKKFKEGKNRGQVYYVLKLGGAKGDLLARREDLTEEKWTQIQKMTILGKNLVFKYRKFFNNKQIIDFYLQGEDK